MTSHRGPRKLLSLAGRLVLALGIFGTAAGAAVPVFADSIITAGALQLTQISSGPAVLGKPVSFTISTTNTTNGVISGVLLGGKLPAGMPVSSILGPGGNPDLCVRGGNAFSCSMGDLVPGASATMSFSGTPPLAGLATPTVTVTAVATGCQGSTAPGGVNCATTGGQFVTTASILKLPLLSAAPPPALVAVPIAPTAVHAVAGNAQATVTWVPPLSDGGSAITSYTVTSSPGGITATVIAPATVATLTGLTNGTTYTFTVTPKSAFGTGLTSSPSNNVTPAAPVVLTAPSGPTGVTATAGDAQATVAWVAPLSTGGSPITSYTVTSSPPTAPITVPALATSARLTGLTNGTSYTFTVTAANAVGSSPASAPSNSVTPVAPVTAPGAPTGVTATAGNAAATVSWTTPLSDGGSAITNYTVSVATANGAAPAAPISTTVAAPATSAALTGLTNGTAYTFTVLATNAVGNSAASLASNSVTPKAPAAVPGAPTAVSATAGDASATVSWTAPANDGGSAITSYTVSSTPATAPVTVTGTSATLTGLTNGTSYTFTVMATNAVGNGAASLASNSVTPKAPATVPGAPTAVSATAGDGSATVSWTAPLSDGGSAITNYTVSVATANGVAPAAPISTTVGAPATSASLTSLINGTAYTFTVVAINAVGHSAASAPSNSVTPVAAATVPGAPTAVSATAGDASATVSWTAPASDGGSAIASYTVSSTPATAPVTVTGTSATLTGLTNGTSYTFTVIATNAVGNSAPSAASNSVTPKAPATVPGAPTAVSATGGDASAIVSWTAPLADGGSAITSYTVRVATANGAAPAAPITATVTAPATTATITGLTNGTAYTFTVTATNAVGTSLLSAPSNSVTAAAPAVAANVENENENPNRGHPRPVPPARPPLLPIINHTP